MNRVSTTRLSVRVALVALALCLLQTGCVRRRMTLVSNPPGAVAFVDEQRIGVTPVSTPFVYYGTRNIRLVKDGFETLAVKQPFRVPWYEFPPLDFVVENLWPHEVRDERVVEFDLIPQQVVPNEKLLDRGEMLRGNAQAGHVTPLWIPPAEQIPLPAEQIPAPPAEPPANQLPPPPVGSGLMLTPGGG